MINNLKTHFKQEALALLIAIVFLLLVSIRWPGYFIPALNSIGLLVIGFFVYIWLWKH